MNSRNLNLRPVFVDYIPDELEVECIYLSIKFSTAAHKCACGCEQEVVTPFSPTDWKMIFDGKTITLHPSIGNWSFYCKSHYWIKNNRVLWAEHWSSERVNENRKVDNLRKQQLQNRSVQANSNQAKTEKPKKNKISSILSKIIGKWIL